MAEDIVFSLDDKKSGYIKWRVYQVLNWDEVVVTPEDNTLQKSIMAKRDLFRQTRSGKIHPLDETVSPSSFVVETGPEYKLRRASKARRIGSYPVLRRQQCENKLFCNKVFANACVAMKEGGVVFLDTPSCETLKMLLSVGVAYDRMYTPQIEKDEYEEMKGWAHVGHESLKTYVERTQDRIGAIWMDYCCSWGGNDRMCPQTDLKALMERGLVVCPGGWVFITVCMRGLSEIRMTECVKEMVYVFPLHKWEMVYHVSYGQMRFFGFTSV